MGARRSLLRSFSRLSPLGLAVACGSGSSAPGASTPLPPRPLAPASASYVTSRRPVFRWQLAAGSDGAGVELCADRACARPVIAFDAAGDHGAPPVDLPPGVVFWRLRAKAGGASRTTPGVTWELSIPARSAPLALSWGALLDGNGDGFGDVVAGDADALQTTANVYVHLGGPHGPAARPSLVLSSPTASTLYAESIASAGDVDGDGFPELLVGAPGEDRVYVYRGGGAAGFVPTPAWILTGPPRSSFGAAVSSAGDVNGDGYADVVVGMPRLAPRPPAQLQGGAAVYFGGEGGLSGARAMALPTPGTDEQDVGLYVATAGDLDGDGLADVAVYGGLGTADPQRILVYRGSAGAFGDAPPLALQYEGGGTTWLGPASLLACAGDVNGDGYTDLAMASAVPPNTGTEVDHVSLFFGGAAGPSLVPSRRIDGALAAGDHFAVSLAAADFDGDGAQDLAVATVSYAHPAVTAQVFAGGASASTLAATLTSSDASTTLEREIGASDVDGDGYPDLLVGFPARTSGSGSAARHGAVEVHRGGPHGVATSASFTLLPPDGTTAAYGASLAHP